MKKQIGFMILCLIAIGIAFIYFNPLNQNEPEEKIEEVVTKEPEKEPSLSKVDQIMKDMSLEEKIGQLFMIRPDALDPKLTVKEINNEKISGTITLSQSMKESLQKYPVGGIVMFSKNITTPKVLTSFIDSLQDTSSIPLFMGIDEEGGLVARIANSSQFHVKKYKNMTTIGNTKNPDLAKDVGKTIGTYLKEYGFNLDFAPDADVNTNPNNPIIGTRSFGSEPILVGEMVRSAVEGFHEVNMMTSIKHFPGHGDTKTDTHLGYASTEKTWEQMKECELIPFQEGIKANTDMVMVSHITAINVTTDNLPSSLSQQIITDKLRNELGYKGVIITDSLSMEAITKQYNAKDAAIQALMAGNDILLMSEDYKKAYDGLIEAVDNGTITEERINTSVKRILELKNKYNLL